MRYRWHKTRTLWMIARTSPISSTGANRLVFRAQEMSFIKYARLRDKTNIFEINCFSYHFISRYTQIIISCLFLFEINHVSHSVQHGHLVVRSYRHDSTVLFECAY